MMTEKVTHTIMSRENHLCGMCMLICFLPDLERLLFLHLVPFGTYLESVEG